MTVCNPLIPAMLACLALLLMSPSCPANLLTLPLSLSLLYCALGSGWILSQPVPAVPLNIWFICSLVCLFALPGVCRETAELMSRHFFSAPELQPALLNLCPLLSHQSLKQHTRVIPIQCNYGQLHTVFVRIISRYYKLAT